MSLQVVTPQKLGGVYIYDQPNQGYQDYDVPPSRYFPAQNGNGRLSADGAPTSVYDTPTSARSRGQQHLPHPNDVYDVPPSAHAHIPIGSLSPSNRSSTASVLSTGSTATVSSSGTSSGPGGCGGRSGFGGSNPPSTCGSARSSTEVQDIYDVPPPAKAVVVVPKSPLAVFPSGQQLTSAGCSGPQEVYDTPRAPTPAGVAKILIEDYDCPPKRTTTSRDVDSGIDASKEEGAYDVPQNYNKQQEHDIDNIYDHPTNNAPTYNVQKQQGRVQGLSVAGGVQDGSIYDIPPQVTRDSAISMRSDCSSLIDDVSSRLSSCSVASSGGSSDAPHVPYDELPLDIDAAMELLVKLQQEVHSATSRLLSFVHSAWRQQEQLEPKLYNVKLGCLGVQATLQEFVDFGQGTLANSAKADDKKLVKKLYQLLEPLQESLKTVNKGMRHLNELNWSIIELVSTAGPQNEQTDGDALGSIALQAKEVPGSVRILASCIQGNSTLLFKRAQQVEGSSSANSSPKKGPPTRPKPPPVMPKPKPGAPGVSGPVREASLERRTSVQDRPLPAPPVRNDPLSPGTLGAHADSSAVYEVPHGDDPGDLDGDNKDKNYNSKEDFLEDYDYVHLENRPAPAADSVSTQRADGTATEDETDSGIVANDSGSGSGTGLTQKFQERLQQLQGDNNNISKPGEGGSGGSKSKPCLHPNDRQLLSFYAGQVGTHTAQLVNAIDAFFQCIEYNQPPKVFIAHSKSVVMAAHRMVYICDTIHRNLLNEEVRVKVMACANYLCDCLKLTVTATKGAALQYPSVVTVQEMVDRVVDVSHASNEIKLVITQAATIL